MGNCIAKLVDDSGAEFYLEWSSIVDAPVTYGGTVEELREYILEEYGRRGLERLPARLLRADRTGTSYQHMKTTAEELVEGNRAGPNGTTLSYAEIVRKYCHERPEGD